MVDCHYRKCLKVLFPDDKTLQLLLDFNGPLIRRYKFKTVIKPKWSGLSPTGNRNRTHIFKSVDLQTLAMLSSDAFQFWRTN